MSLKKRHTTPVPIVAPLAGIVLPIDTTHGQQQPNWCWAACLSVDLSYRGQPLSQCDIAGLVLNQHCCAFPPLECNDAGAGGATPSPCDQGATSAQIAALLTAKGLPAYMTAGTLTADHLTTQIVENKSLVGVVMKFGAGGHMRLVYGIAGNKFHVYDPCWETSVETLSTLKHFNGGAWIFSWSNL